MTEADIIENDMREILIVGGGQVGTSLAMAARKKFPHIKITVLDTDPNLRDDFSAAFRRAGIDGKDITFAANPDEVTSNANLVILATPISQFGEAIKSVAHKLPGDAIITDIGSAKVPSIKLIQEAISEACPRLSGRYVPGHILNGNAGSGPLSASPKSPTDKTLMEGQPMVLVPDVAEASAFQLVEKFWESLGARVFSMSAEEHDKVVGTMSHLEHALMFSLIQTNFFKDGEGKDIGDWVHGERGMTRIAKSGTEMWRAIFEDNRDNIRESARHFKEILRETAELAQQRGFSTIIEEAHAYAAEVRGDRGGSPVDPSEYLVRDDLINSAFGALISVAITRNVQRIQKETGQPIADIANPSLKDGMGPIGIDPAAVSALLTQYGPRLIPMIDRYIKKLDVLLEAIENGNNPAVCQFIDQARETREAILDKPRRPEEIPERKPAP